jgi:purine-binding chemotaxis protein CheW
MDTQAMETTENTREQMALQAGGQPELLELVKSIDQDIVNALQQGGGQVVVEKKEEQREHIGYTICFILAGMKMAIPLSSVQEAGQLQVLQELPLLPDWISGITNIRGEIVSVIDLKRFLGIGKKRVSPGQPYLVIYNKDVKMAIAVDGIIGTRSLYRLPEKLSHLPSDASRPQQFFAGWAMYLERNAEKEISLFDVHGFLSSPRLRNATTA